MKKTQVAFEMSAERLSRRGQLFFWTFTFKDLLTITDTRQRWNHFLTLMRRRWPKMCGLRVFEMHKNHGLHVHLLTDRFLDVREARKMAAKAGWGRIHVKRIPASKTGYLSKYLSKERPPCFKRWRLWAAFGTEWAWTKVCNLVSDSAFARVYRNLSEYHGWEGNENFFERMAVVAAAVRRQTVRAGTVRAGPRFCEIRRAMLAGGSVILW